MAPYGSGTTDVAQLNTQSSAFVDQIHVPRGYRKARTRAVQQIAALFKQADEVLQKLDAYMAVYQYNHYTLFSQYKTARAIDNRPAGHTVHKKRGKVLPGFVAHAAFREGVMSTLERVRASHVGKSVLVVSSGGPISTAVAHILGAPAATAIDLNMRMRNSSLTEFVFSARRMELVSFNAIPHLEDPARRAWVTYA